MGSGGGDGQFWVLISYSLIAQRLDLFSRFVKKHKGKIITFGKQQHFQLRICDLDETFYAGQSDMLEDWEVLYLPKPVKMEVLGIVDDVPCLATGQQLVILAADNGSIYAYEEELLHRVGKTLKEFLREGLQLFGEDVYPCAKDLEPEVSHQHSCLWEMLAAPGAFEGEMWSEYRSGSQKRFTLASALALHESPNLSASGAYLLTGDSRPCSPAS